MDKARLEEIAEALVAPGKGILAADESNGTMSNRLEGVGLESSAEARRAYRANLFATPNCEKAVSGVILYDETIKQTMDDGTTRIPDYLHSRGILPGIKVDTGTIDLEGCPGEKVTKGIEAEPENGWDDLATRCTEYVEKFDARFAKWRAVIKIGLEQGIPSKKCIYDNADALARYARICQDAGLVPIIEPEVLMDGDHIQSECHGVTSWVLEETYERCKVHEVHLPGTLLKPNMIIWGKDDDQIDGRKIDGKNSDDVATETVHCLHKTVPKDVGGIVFLSGGQSDKDATDRLNRMNAMDVEHPWQLSYSYGRALQAEALKAWAEDGAEASQAAFSHRADMNSLARDGEWNNSLESQ